ncbi:hypothetical protein [Arthrobacter oryzae]|uniref:hypothetical protein n=1 Tax=Arthrobacter oryzae TaxID=409290 RepID=UPI00277FD344|nr:hypothetical protein [Arthrobacter oryzae]MDQ0078582.1 catechol 2,3-dioxygenase-like lactoylglutathione lyase family enzyme [Arthrobacter oryzae]
MAPNVPALYHPTLAVPDLEEARTWFRKVFERPDLRWEETLDLSLLNPDYPVNYSFFAFITDIHWVFLCPTLHAQGALAGQTRYKGVSDGMIGLGWYTDDAVGMFEKLAGAGIRAHDQQGKIITNAKPPTSSFASDVFTGFTMPEDTGIRYEFQETGERHWEHYARQADPRLRPEWKGPSPDPNDPLSIVLTSHHTILTGNPARLSKLYVDVLEGQVIGHGHNAALDAESTFIRLADTVLECAVPEPDSPYSAKLSDGRDLYYGVSFLVKDPEAAGAHLAQVDVPFTHDGGSVVIEPVNGFGAQWRFIPELPYPAAERRQPQF